jgi:hypothetical protein
VKQFLMAVLICAAYLSISQAAEIQTNAVHMADSPSWVTRVRVEKIIDHIQMVLEWDIHRIEVLWHKDQASFEKVHSLGPTAIAVSLKADNTIHLGPRITSANFDQVFGHELVHTISAQKYKGAIPAWLEEGLANYLAKTGKVDYKFLASQPYPADVRKLTHPYGGSVDNIHYHYMASQALVEMIAKKCDLTNLLRLSVGEKMDNYLETYCEIPDLNAAFKKWVMAHR